jgi:23S rRNA pseudouridine2457 synthase
MTVRSRTASSNCQPRTVNSQQMSLLLFNKPYQVLSQFMSTDAKQTLADFLRVPQVRAAGRLDYDSEGLLLLTDDGLLQSRLADPKWKCEKVYLAQLEGIVDESALARLRDGVLLSDGMTLPARADRIDEPDNIWPRDPPIRFRKNIPTSWIRLAIREGRNRQVRRMTAAVGFPTLRLVRWSVGLWTVEGLHPGEYREVARSEVAEFMSKRLPRPSTRLPPP